MTNLIRERARNALIRGMLDMVTIASVKTEVEAREQRRSLLQELRKPPTAMNRQQRRAWLRRQHKDGGER